MKYLYAMMSPESKELRIADEKLVFLNFYQRLLKNLCLSIQVKYIRTLVQIYI